MSTSKTFTNVETPVAPSTNYEVDHKKVKARKYNNEASYSVVPLAATPQILTCPHCHVYITTEVTMKPSFKTHLKAVALCVCCMCFIPYICAVCMNVDHFCPECENYIGTYIN